MRKFVTLTALTLNLAGTVQVEERRPDGFARCR